ncbi:MAG: hypothetical protein ACRDWI_20400 [Jiangellaceae bacterium]
MSRPDQVRLRRRHRWGWCSSSFWRLAAPGAASAVQLLLNWSDLSSTGYGRLLLVIPDNGSIRG